MRRTVLPAVSLFLVLALGCGGCGSSEPVNSIKIESVTPATAAPGVPATFTVTVSYDLQTADSAAIYHSWCESSYFGDRWSDIWMGCPASITDITVSRGQGTRTITVTEAFTGARDLWVILMPNQDSNSAVGVASDEQTIPVP
jgi:hypothetical protein